MIEGQTLSTLYTVYWFLVFKLQVKTLVCISFLSALKKEYGKRIPGKLLSYSNFTIWRTRNVLANKSSSG